MKSTIFNLALPAVLSCSYAFMLPAATAPNAIVKETAGIPTFTMMKAGFVMNLVCVATTVVFVMSWGRVVFDFGQELPDWLTSNSTDYENCTVQT